LSSFVLELHLVQVTALSSSYGAGVGLELATGNG